MGYIVDISRTKPKILSGNGLWCKKQSTLMFCITWKDLLVIVFDTFKWVFKK